jgi:Bifunctional DNA primase/polymerase, N-terminal
MGAPNAAWALEYAAIGWRVHPCFWIRQDSACSCGEECNSPGKHPILKAWQRQATTDPALITRWWRRTPEANIAVATGPGSDIFVLDVDGPEGERNLAALERKHGPLPEIYPQQWTGSGVGWQAFFRYPEGRTIRNSVGRLGPKLDTRGIDGYVLLPPSNHRSGNRYEWAVDRKPGSIPPEPAPEWLVDLLDPSPQPEAPRQDWKDLGRPTDDRYLLRALEAELALVASAPEGRRNDQLNESAFNLFRFAQEGRLDAGAIAHGLEAAARHAGLDDREIASTLKSAAAKRGVQLR